MSGKNTIGIILIILGLGFFLQQAEIIEFKEIIENYWPLVLVIMGCIQLLRRNVSFVGGIIMILIGGLLQANISDSLPANLTGYIWPSILILVGLRFVFSSNRFKQFEKYNVKDEDMINNLALFSGVETKNNSQCFKGGNIAAFFGGAEIDLTKANLSREGASLDLTAAFGGITIRVPYNWNVVASGVPIFGGWENKTRYEGPVDDSKTIYIKCFVAFGGIEIKN